MENTKNYSLYFVQTQFRNRNLNTNIYGMITLSL